MTSPPEPIRQCQIAPLTMDDLQKSYLIKHAQSLDLLKDLKNVLVNLPAPGHNNGVQWGHIRSLEKLNHKLRDALQFAQK